MTGSCGVFMRYGRIRPLGSCGRQADAVVLGPRDRVPPGSFLPPPPDDLLPGGQVKGTLPVSLRDRCATPDMPRPLAGPAAIGVREGNEAGAAGSGRATAWVHRDCKTVSPGDDPSYSLKLLNSETGGPAEAGKALV